MAAVALVSDVEAIHALVDAVPAAAEALMRRHWPGPLSIIFPASSLVPPRVRGEGGRIALRVPKLRCSARSWTRWADRSWRRRRT